MGGEAPPLPTAPQEPLPSPCPGSRQAGVTRVPSPCLQAVVQRGLEPRARQLLANSSALVEAVLREEQRLGRGECWGEGAGGRGRPFVPAHVWGARSRR